MSGSVNKVILLGNLGKDPECRTFQDGTKVANFSLATSETWKDRATGEKRERTEWHQVAVLGPLANVAEEYLRKGSKVYLQGKLQTRKWQDQSGQDRYTTEVVVRGYGAELVLLDKAGTGHPPPATSPTDYGQQPAPTGGWDAQAVGDPDDQIPF